MDSTQDTTESPVNGGGEPSFFDGVPERPQLVEVERISGKRPSDDRGLCGTVPASSQVKQIVQARWGGGHYKVKGYDSKGKPRYDVFELPGESRPILEDSEPDYEPPPTMPPWYGPQFGGPPGFGAPPPQFAPPWQPPGFAQAYSQQGNREIDRLNRENESLRAELRRAQDKSEDEARRLREQVADLKERLKGEETKAMLADLNAQHQRQIADLQAAVGGSEAGDSWRPLVEAMRQNQDTMARVFQAASKDRLNTADLLQLVKSSGGATETLAMLQAMKDFLTDDKGEDSWQSVAKDAVKKIGPVLGDMVQRGQEAQPQPQPQPVQQPARIEQKPPEARPLKLLVPWSTILAEVTAYHRNGNGPKIAASHFKSFYRGLPGWPAQGEMPSKDALIAILPMGSAKDLGQKLQGLVAYYVAHGDEDGKAKSEAFLGLLKDETSSKWIDEFLAALK